MPTIYANSTDGSVGAATSLWDVVHDATGAKQALFTSAHSDTAVRAGMDDAAIFRVFMSFDTSGISVAPTSATLKIYGKANDTSNLIVVKSTQSSADNNTFNDLDGYEVGFDDDDLTAYSSQITSWSTSGYNDITLNSTALNDMVSEDEFKVAIINYDYDYLDVEPAGGVNVTAGMYFTQETGTDKDPYID